jgi:hypothetical protein
MPSLALEEGVQTTCHRAVPARRRGPERVERVARRQAPAAAARDEPPASRAGSARVLEIPRFRGSEAAVWPAGREG